MQCLEMNKTEMFMCYTGLSFQTVQYTQQFKVKKKKNNTYIQQRCIKLIKNAKSNNLNRALPEFLLYYIYYILNIYFLNALRNE